eukprot:scaffold473_cov112-Cyclotella_meneghiniana.AAC.1
MLQLKLLLLECDAFLQPSQIVKPTQRHDVQRFATTKPRDEFLDSLDLPYELNANSPARTRLLQNLIDFGATPGGVNLSKPGSAEAFESVAPGTWKVVYAPHMTIAAGLLKGEFKVQYDLKDDGTIVSHARVDFDEAWWRQFDDDSFLDGPYPTIESVPESLSKNIVRQLGRALFIEPFAVFPVSYLDNEIIVFDFELLGTRICARKES